LTSSGEEPLLTLEPLLDALRAAIEGAGWTLSGLQKTTSHQFEGRWEGDSTRSAYLFFHPPAGPEFVSVDVYLDETSRGLSGNLALVVDLVPFGAVGSVEDVLTVLAGACAREIPESYRRPLTLRFRLADAEEEVDDAETEARLKVRIPRAAIEGGEARVTSFTDDVMDAFSRLLRAPELRALADEGD